MHSFLTAPSWPEFRKCLDHTFRPLSVVLCGAESWTRWSLWDPSNSSYSTIPHFLHYHKLRGQDGRTTWSFVFSSELNLLCVGCLLGMQHGAVPRQTGLFPPSPVLPSVLIISNPSPSPPHLHFHPIWLLIQQKEKSAWKEKLAIFSISGKTRGLAMVKRKYEYLKSFMESVT